MPHPLTIYTTSLPQPARPRTQQEYLLRTLMTLKIPYELVDCSMDEDGKRTWRRKGRTDGKLPGYLVQGEFVGTIEDFEYAVEDGRLRDFLGLDNIRLSAPSQSPPAPSAAPTATPASDATTPADAPAPAPSEPSAGTETSAAQPKDATTSTGGDTSFRSAEDELLNSVGEDELEKLLREMEADGM